MSIIHKTCGLLLAVALTANGRAQAPPASALPYKSFHAKILVTAAGVSSIPSEIWFCAPDRFRMVNQVVGQQMISIMVGQDVFTYQQGAPIDMKLNRASMPGSEKSADEMLRKAVEWKQRGCRVGSEAVNGRPCDIHEFNETIGGQQSTGKVWLWTANDFPLRIVTRTGSIAAEMTVTEVQLNVALPDTLFELPAGVPFQDMGGLMRGVNPELLRQQFGRTRR
jgi:outer membrane lipoprotein-sorting protein